MTQDNSNFTHLRLHSEYSLTDGTIRFNNLFKKLKQFGQTNVALTDLNNIYGLVKFYKQAIAADIKPILGAEVSVRYNSGIYNLVLLCQNETGYKNLCEIISLAYLKGQIEHKLAVNFSDLKSNTDGLIALSAAGNGIIANYILNNKEDKAIEAINQHKKIFNSQFYIEIQKLGKSNENSYIKSALKLAEETNTPAVATNHTCFLEEVDFNAHEARVCISGGMLLDDQSRARNYTPKQYLKSCEQMQQLFSDYPMLVSNSELIAQKCNVHLTFGESYLPDFPNEFGMKEDEYLIKLAKEGLKQRLLELYKTDKEIAKVEQTYSQRLDLEIKTINQMGFPGYFLIVADFIAWSKQNDIPVGPGRGSGAGSLVAYSLSITDLDPLKYNLLFERFLNPERVSMPDFDIDFCMDKRDLVIEYVARKYGKDKVSQIATHGTMAAKAVIRDVGRVLGNSYGFVDSLAKLIPFEIGMTLTKALDIEPELAKRYETDDEVKTLLDLALSLEGLARNVGKHAGGVVISPTKLTDFSAIYCEQDSKSIIVQYDKDDIEAVGLVKFDFLGLKTLTVIDWAVKIINKQNKKNNKEALDISKINLNDKKTYSLLKKQQTTAVFQLESSGMKDLIKRLQPDDFEEIIALVALFRPGPLQSGMVDDFINVKHKRAEANYPHPKLEEILKPTYGVILYQEQVMQIAQTLASYSLGQADMLRRAMGKKKLEEMAKQRALFLKGSVKNKIDETKANYIFDLMEKFAGYGFNKSHSAAYALVSFQTAWLKAHYPAAFMAAVLSSDMDKTDKVVTFIDDCRQSNLEVVPPNINHSEFYFTVDDENRIIYGLGAIKGAGESALEIIREERKANGHFTSLVDLCKRITSSSKVSRRVLETLIHAGSFDCFDKSRAAMIAFLPEAMKIATQHHRDQSTGQIDLFGGAMHADTQGNEPSVPDLMEYDERERLKLERAALGLYLTGHPINAYHDEITQLRTHTLSELSSDDSKEHKKTPIVIAAQIAAMRVQSTDRGKRAFLMLDDRTGYYELACFSDTYEKFSDHLVNDNIIIVDGALNTDSFSGRTRFRIENIQSIQQARNRFARRLLLTIDQSKANNGIVEALATHLIKDDPDASCPVFVEYHTEEATARLQLGQQFKAPCSDEGIQALKDLLGDHAIALQYR